jgi:hypothetical protein
MQKISHVYSEWGGELEETSFSMIWKPFGLLSPGKMVIPYGYYKLSTSAKEVGA